MALTTVSPVYMYPGVTATSLLFLILHHPERINSKLALMDLRIIVI
jgi:hypothetical protein